MYAKKKIKLEAQVSLYRSSDFNMLNYEWMLLNTSFLFKSEPILKGIIQDHWWRQWLVGMIVRYNSERDHLRTIPTNFGLHWKSSFREKRFLNMFMHHPRLWKGHIVLPLSVRTYVRTVGKFCVKVHFSGIKHSIFMKLHQWMRLG